MIYAYGENPLPSTGDISYHLGNRGTQQLNIISIPNIHTPVMDDQIFDFNIHNVYYILFQSEGVFYYILKIYHNFI